MFFLRMVNACVDSFPLWQQQCWSGGGAIETSQQPAVENNKVELVSANQWYQFRPQTVKDKHGGKWNKNKNRNSRNQNQNQNRGGNGGGAGGRENSFEPSLGPTPTGVTKPGQKTKSGLKLLG